MSTLPWWKNSRGELFVIAQFVLFGLIAFGPRHVAPLPAWGPAWSAFGHAAGPLLMIAGAALVVAGAANLGRNLTPFVCPSAQSVLLERGAYRIVRHPIYSGLLLVAFGWGLRVNGLLTLGFGILLLVLFDRKASREEELLLLRFAGYAAYRDRVPKLIPFIR